MAVNLDISKSIIDAFVAGRNILMQQDEIKKRDAQQKLENEQRQKTIDEGIRQFDATLQQNKTQQDALLKLQEADRKRQEAQFNLQNVISSLEFQKFAEQHGSVPGFRKEPSIDPQGNVDPSKNMFFGPEKIGNLNFEALTPQARAEQDRLNFLSGPKAAEITLEEALRLERENELAAAKQAHDIDMQRRDHANRLEVANRQIAGRVEAAKVANKGIKEANFLSTEANRFNSDPTVRKYSDIKILNNVAKNTGVTGIGDFGLLVAYARATDPRTGVKESEREAIESATQTLQSRFNVKLQNISKLVPFLDSKTSDGRTARDLVREEIESIYKSTKQSYDTLRDETVRRLGELGFEDADRYLVNHDKIRVRRKSDGVTGSINDEDFDPAIYERVE